MSSERLAHFASRLQVLVGDAADMRPLLCDGDPYECRVALVGANPGTTTPFWPFWSDERGCDKAAWLKEYRERHDGKYGRSRAAIERLLPQIRAKVIELNAFAKQSGRVGDLAAEHRTSEVLQFILDQVKPVVAICAGADAHRAVLACAITRPMQVIAAKHFIYWGQATEADLARRVNTALGLGTPLVAAPHEQRRTMTDSGPIAKLRLCPEGKTFMTAGGRGGPFKVKVRDAGRGLAIEFVRLSGGSKSVSEERFLKFWQLWQSGHHDLVDYRNESGQRTRAAAASYVLPVFEWIAKQP